MNKKLNELLKFGWHLGSKAMINKNYQVKNFNEHAKAMMNTVNSLNIPSHFKQSLHEILNSIQHSTTSAVRGHYYGKLNEWLNTLDNKYNSII